MSERFGICGKLGFGFMRLPVQNDEVDLAACCRMVDIFLDAGFNYFDTAHGYLDGKSEIALREALVKRYPRERYRIANKLSNNFFEKNEDIRPFFEAQLAACGVTYFDVYLMHAQNRNVYAKYKKHRAYETALALLAEGRIKHFGISFHDKAEVLRTILTEYPEIEVVQLQFNYIDFEDPSIEARKCYEVCREFGKSVLVMEPVKGGRLANRLPAEAEKIFESLGGGSNASYAIRFAAGFEGVECVLSGMGTPEMVLDNVGYMKEFKPLDAREREAVERVVALLRKQDLISCTACKYCTEVCPRGIAVPDILGVINSMRICNSWNAKHYYHVFTENGPKASDCIGCGKCEAACPQHLPVRALLKQATELFEK